MDLLGTPNNGSSDGSGPKRSLVVYDRARMMEIRETPASRSRPDNLSVEFNDEDGKFSPAKWIENYWIKAGIVNKVVTNTRKKPVDKIKAEAEMDGTVLSPQRKGFSSGCRASSPKVGDDSSADKKTNWRTGSSKSNGVDFKPSFQKTSLENQRSSRNNASSLGNWRSTIADRDSLYKSGTSRGKYGNDRDRGHVVEEKLPEWLDEGPSSMSEVIELKGFDDESRRERRNKLKTKKDVQAKEQDTEKASETTKEAVKTDSPAESKSSSVAETEKCSRIDELFKNSSKIGGGPDYPVMANTVSDLEFATLLGMKIDENSQPRAHVPSTPQTTGSRLSRFFTRNAAPAPVPQARPDSPEVVRRVSVEHLIPSIDANPNPIDKKVVAGFMSLEDLEKSFVRPEQESQRATSNEINIPLSVPSAPQIAGSGLSRFFAKSAAPAPMFKVEPAEIVHRISMDHLVQQSLESNANDAKKVVPGFMSLEDLEKSFVAPNRPEQVPQRVMNNGIGIQQHVPSAPQAGSGLSRFFNSTTTTAPKPKIASPEMGRRVSVEQLVQPSRDTSAKEDKKVVPGFMRLEDLEKSFVAPKRPEPAQEPPRVENNGVYPPPPHLQHPQPLPHHPLPREGLPPVASPYVPPPLPMGIPPIHPALLSSQLNPLAMAAAAHGHSNPVTALQDPKVLGTAVNVMTHIQVQQVLARAPEARTDPGFPAYVNQLMTQNMATIAAAGAGVGVLNMPHPMHGVGQRPSNGPNHSAQNDEMPLHQSPKVPSNFFPTSVLRQMNKAAAHPHAQSMSARSSEANSVVGAPPHNPQTVPSVPVEIAQNFNKPFTSPEAVRLEPENMMSAKAQNGDGEINHNASRSALEQQYSMVVNAMTSGLSMGAYRPPTH